MTRPGSRTGVRREFETLFRSQAERILRDLDVVQREEFEAVKEMARLAREENEALKLRVAALETALGGESRAGAPSGPRREAAPGFAAAARLSAALSCFSSLAAISAATAAPHPWRLPRHLSCMTSLDEELTSWRPSISSKRRRGRGQARGPPGPSVVWPRTRNHLRRQQAAAADLARLRRPASTHLCWTFSDHHSRRRGRRHEAPRHSP